MATHSNTLALKIPWMEELGAGYYPWGRKESEMTERRHSLTDARRTWLFMVEQVFLLMGRFG